MICFLIDPYWAFVECTRITLSADLYKSEDMSLAIRIMPKDTAWIMDGVYDGYDKDGPGVEGSMAPIFHHGVKLKGNQDEDLNVFYKYKLKQFGIDTEGLQAVMKETCEPIQTPARCSEGGIHLGKFPITGECAKEAKRHPRCGDIFMFSPSYPEWGCTCCAADNEPIVHQDDQWGLYSSASCLLNTSTIATT